MSSSSTVTYTSVYTDSEPGRLVASPSPDYVPGPEPPTRSRLLPGPEHPPSPVEGDVLEADTTRMSEWQALTSRYEVEESSTAAPRPTEGRQTQLFKKLMDWVEDSQFYYETAQLLDQSLFVFRKAWPNLWTVISSMGQHSCTSRLEIILSTDDRENNMPPKRSSATARDVAAATAATTPIIVGTEGVVVLSQWFEKMESVFHIGNYAVENQDVAYAMDWKALKKMMAVKYCPKGVIKKLEIELWNLKNLLSFPPFLKCKRRTSVIFKIQG
ncbi:hypothetical protein Tco_1316358 [Tanacetum coccineum]